MSTYQLWDIEQWPRRNQFQFFRTYEDPFFQLCGNIEVTRLYQYAKEQQLSYSLSCLYFALAAANRQEEFRLRWLDGQLVLFDRIHAGQTILAADNTFLFCYFEWEADAAAFVAKGKANIERQLASRELDPNTSQQDLIYFSVIPWISFTGLKHARRGPAGRRASMIVSPAVWLAIREPDSRRRAAASRPSKPSPEPRPPAWWRGTGSPRAPRPSPIPSPPRRRPKPGRRSRAPILGSPPVRRPCTRVNKRAHPWGTRRGARA